MYDNLMRLNLPPRMAMRYYESATPASWDMRKLNKKWYWRALSWFLKKLGGQYREHVPESYPLTECQVDQRNIIRLLETSARAMDYLWNKKATTLVLGYDEMEKLITDAPTEMMQFGMPVYLQRNEPAHEYEYRTGYKVVSQTVQLRVVLVPWLSGWALLPDFDAKV